MGHSHHLKGLATGTLGNGAGCRNSTSIPQRGQGSALWRGLGLLLSRTSLLERIPRPLLIELFLEQPEAFKLPVGVQEVNVSGLKPHRPCGDLPGEPLTLQSVLC